MHEMNKKVTFKKVLEIDKNHDAIGFCWALSSVTSAPVCVGAIIGDMFGKKEKG